MSKESTEEIKEKATVLSHVANAVLPAVNLAPWMSIGDKKDIYVRAGLKTIADIGEEIERQAWMLENPDKPKPERASEDDEEELPEFDPAKMSGAVYIMGYSISRMGQNIHNFSPSIGGLRTRQAIGYGSALKSGIAVEPKKRSLLDKIMGKNKDNQQPSGGA